MGYGDHRYSIGLAFCPSHRILGTVSVSGNACQNSELCHLFTVLQISFSTNRQIDKHHVPFRIGFDSVTLEILTNTFRDTMVSKVLTLVCVSKKEMKFTYSKLNLNV